MPSELLVRSLAFDLWYRFIDVWVTWEYGATYSPNKIERSIFLKRKMRIKSVVSAV